MTRLFVVGLVPSDQAGHTHRNSLPGNVPQVAPSVQGALQVVMKVLMQVLVNWGAAVDAVV